MYILPTSFPNNDNASIYKPKCDFPMRKTMIFLSFFRENDTQKRIDPHTSAAHCAAVFNDDSHSIANVCFFLGLNGTVICLISPLLAAPRGPSWPAAHTGRPGQVLALTFDHGDC